MYKNKTRHGGRPNIDIVIMVKLLVLQHWFGLSDPELERQVADRISFRIFLGTTEVVPDFSTVWLFRERLIFKRNTPQLAAVGMKGMRIQLGLVSA